MTSYLRNHERLRVSSLAQTDDLSSLARLAATVFTPWSYDPGAYDCIGDWGVQKSHGSPGSVTCCKQPPGLVGSHSMDESQMQCTPIGDDIHDKSPSCSNSGLSSRCQAPVEIESLPQIYDHAKSGVSSDEKVQVQPAGKEEDGGSSGVSGLLPTPKSG